MTISNNELEYLSDYNNEADKLKNTPKYRSELFKKLKQKIGNGGGSSYAINDIEMFLNKNNIKTKITDTNGAKDSNDINLGLGSIAVTDADSQGNRLVYISCRDDSYKVDLVLDNGTTVNGSLFDLVNQGKLQANGDDTYQGIFALGNGAWAHLFTTYGSDDYIVDMTWVGEVTSTNLYNYTFFTHGDIASDNTSGVVLNSSISVAKVSVPVFMTNVGEVLSHIGDVAPLVFEGTVTDRSTSKVRTLRLVQIGSDLCLSGQMSDGGPVEAFHLDDSNFSINSELLGGIV